MFQAFFFRRPATLESAAICSLPCGGGLGRGYFPNFGNLPQHLHRPNTSLAACCPLSNSLPRERGRAAVAIKGSARKTGCAGCFLLFRRPAINGCKMAANPSCLSNRQNSQNLLPPAPSPVGEGWGEGILRISAIFPNTLSAQIQALRLVALSLTLSHGERGLGDCSG